MPQEHKAKFSHELISGAAAFEGMKMFEDHQRREGEPVSHGFAKELLAGFVGGEVDRLAETKGEDAWDRHKAKERAQRGAEQMYDDHYGRDDQYNPQQRDPPNFSYDRQQYGERREGGRREEYRREERGDFQQGGGYQQDYQQDSFQQGGYQQNYQQDYERRY